MIRPARETYVRVSCETLSGRRTVEPGLEYREGDDFAYLTGLLLGICRGADRGSGHTLLEEAELVARGIARAYPDRAYFVEVHSVAGWIQIFQPYGVPKNG